MCAPWDAESAVLLAPLVAPALRGLAAAPAAGAAHAPAAGLEHLEVRLEGQLPLDGDPGALAGLPGLRSLALATSEPATVAALPAGLTALDVSILVPAGQGQRLSQVEAGLAVFNTVKQLSRWPRAAAPCCRSHAQHCEGEHAAQPRLPSTPPHRPSQPAG